MCAEKGKTNGKRRKGSGLFCSKNKYSMKGKRPKSLIVYRKRLCISRTFFHKIEAKNRECGLSMDTSMLGVFKNQLNIHKTS